MRIRNVVGAAVFIHIVQSVQYNEAGARILKHSMEAEKSTFQGELSL
jgi:hypothetical protein